MPGEPDGSPFALYAMQAAFALLPHHDSANVACRLAWDLHRKYRTGLFARRLPPRVSLKQPFDIDDMEELAGYGAELARRIEPFPIELAGCALFEHPPEAPEVSVISVSVRETDYLRSLHDRLNAELAGRYGERRASFDGDAYRFHLTIAVGFGIAENFRQGFTQCQSATFPPVLLARELALFAYDDAGDKVPDWQFIPYRIYPLGS